MKNSLVLLKNSFVQYPHSSIFIWFSFDMFDILVSPCDLMKNKSLELILKPLIYLEKHLYLLPLLPRLWKPCLQLLLHFLLQPIPLHAHTLFLRPMEASLYLNLMDKWMLMQHFCIWLLNSAWQHGWFLPPSVSCSCFQHATLLILLRWWFLLSFFCCLLFDLYHLLLPVSEVSILVFFLSFFTILNCGKIQITESLPSNIF